MAECVSNNEGMIRCQRWSLVGLFDVQSVHRRRLVM